MNWKFLADSGALLLLTICLYIYMKREKRIAKEEGDYSYSFSRTNLWISLLAMALGCVVLFFRGVFNV